MLSLTLKWRLKRNLTLRRDTGQMPALARLPVKNSRVLRDSVVPEHNGTRLPADASMEVSTVGEVVIQELEQGVGFLLLVADDFACDCAKFVSISLSNSRDRQGE